jgi:hypothetical protein
MRGVAALPDAVDLPPEGRKCAPGNGRVYAALGTQSTDSSTVRSRW